MVHKFMIKDGKVTFMNKLLNTASYMNSVKDNRLYPQFGTSDVCSNIFGRIKTFFSADGSGISDNTNVNVVPYGTILFFKPNNIFWGNLFKIFL
jgi:hypothetical protein